MNLPIVRFLVRTSRKLAWSFLLPIALWANGQQVNTSGTDQSLSNEELLKRIEQLEAQVRQLRQNQTTEPEPAPAPAPAPETSRVNSAGEVKLNLFGDVGFKTTDFKPSRNSFEFGSLDLFMTAHLSEKTSALAELLFIPRSDNTIDFDVERLLLQHRWNDYFSAGIGRYHTSIGYYNTAFHQGAWFETSVDRPFMYAFDDEGGFLPLQEVGITASGLIPSGKLGLSYVAEVGNGRDQLLGAEPAQNAQDNNNGKSFNFALSAHPSWASGLDVGFSIYHDNLTFFDGDNQSELISTVHAIYLNSTYEFLNEAMLVRHASSVRLPGVFHTPAFYTQFSRKVHASYHPYFRYQYINAAIDEPIYGDPNDGPVVGRRNGTSVGLRYDFTEHSAFKVQYDRAQSRGAASSNGLDTQFAFAF